MMRRILHVELDAGYFDRFAEPFLKSFYAYNKGWDLYVVDFGLTDAQRKLLSQYGVVERYQMGSTRRYVHIDGRLQSWEKLVRDDAIVMHVDADLVVLDNYEDLVETLLKEDHDCVAQTFNPKLPTYIRYLPGIADMLGIPVDDPCLMNRRIHLGWILMRGRPQVTDAIEWMRRNYDACTGFLTEEETLMSLVFFSRGLKVKHVDAFVDCPLMSFDGGPIPSAQPNKRHKKLEQSRMIHFAMCKYYMDNAAPGMSHEYGMAWRDVLLGPYAKLSWPAPEDVCERK